MGHKRLHENTGQHILWSSIQEILNNRSFSMTQIVRLASYSLSVDPLTPMRTYNKPFLGLQTQTCLEENMHERLPSYSHQCIPWLWCNHANIHQTIPLITNANMFRRKYSYGNCQPAPSSMQNKSPLFLILFSFLSTSGTKQIDPLVFRWN